MIAPRGTYFVDRDQPPLSKEAEVVREFQDLYYRRCKQALQCPQRSRLVLRPIHPVEYYNDTTREIVVQRFAPHCSFRLYSG
jgi:hypothetical protein